MPWNNGSLFANFVAGIFVYDVCGEKNEEESRATAVEAMSAIRAMLEKSGSVRPESGIARQLSPRFISPISYQIPKLHPDRL